jgi:hypothetical protein
MAKLLAIAGFGDETLPPGTPSGVRDLTLEQKRAIFDGWGTVLVLSLLAGASLYWWYSGEKEDRER